MEISKVSLRTLRNVWEKRAEGRARKENRASFSLTSAGDKEVVTEISTTALFSQSKVNKVEELKLLIESGLYRLDARTIAENIIEELLND